MKRNLYIIAVGVLTLAGCLSAEKKQDLPKKQVLSKIQDLPKEYWCIGPVGSVDPSNNQMTIQMKESGMSAQPKLSVPMRLGNFKVAAGSATSEVERTFTCAPGCRVVTKEKPDGATLGDLRNGDWVRVTYNETGNGYVAFQIIPYTPASSNGKR